MKRRTFIGAFAAAFVLLMQRSKPKPKTTVVINGHSFEPYVEDEDDFQIGDFVALDDGRMGFVTEAEFLDAFCTVMVATGYQVLVPRNSVRRIV